jgi:hypothetical protein
VKFDSKGPNVSFDSGQSAIAESAADRLTCLAAIGEEHRPRGVSDQLCGP